jgi:hypothetical protein
MINNSISEGLIIVSRTNAAERFGFEHDPLRMPILDLTHDEVAQRYKGFDGIFWGGSEFETKYDFLSEDGIAALCDYDKVSEVLANDFPYHSDLIFLKEIGRPLNLPDSFRFEGYEFGYFHSVYDCYSVILNEIIYGLHSEMRASGCLLNGQLLFKRLADAEHLKTSRMFLVNRGVDLETDDICTPIEIWRYFPLL